MFARVLAVFSHTFASPTRCMVDGKLANVASKASLMQKNMFFVFNTELISHAFLVLANIAQYIQKINSLFKRECQAC